MLAEMRHPYFVDRGPERAEFRQRNEEARSAGQPHLILFTGPQGVGKTVLATEACHEIAEHYEIVLFCDALGSQGPNGRLEASQIALRLLEALHVARDDIPAQDDLRILALRNRLAGRKVLLYLDDVATADQVLPLLFGSPQLAVVVTSRSSFDKLRMNGFTTSTVTTFGPEAAAELVVKRTGTVVGAREIEAVNRICEGLPLALSVAATRLSDTGSTPAEYVAELSAGNPLFALQIDDEHPVLKIFDLAYTELTEEERFAFKALSLLPGVDFGTAIAAAVLGLVAPHTKRLLERLAKGNLIERTGPGRYRYHSLLREFAKDKALSEFDESDFVGVATKAVQWNWRLAVSLDKALSNRPAPLQAESHYAEIEAFEGDAWAEFTKEWPNIVAAAKEARALPTEEIGAIFPFSLWYFGYQTKRHDDVIDAYQEILGRWTAPPDRWQVLRDLTGLHEAAEEFDRTDAYVKEALVLDYPQGRQSTYDWYALAQEGRGDHEFALELFGKSREAVASMEVSRQPRALALLDMHTGRVLFKLGRFEDARGPAAAAWEFFRAAEGEEANKAFSGGRLGMILRELGEDAEELLVHALALFERLGMAKQAEEIRAVLSEE
ncbi:NB-ARC domain-containing protein [Amycolatopsis sp. NPDC057786]|uniref:NB-ARC domain-containing protein n=1 Tax=Amycolatopsis sp. NPDC057786 TaxID=3346250 RepID=UPI003670C5CE